MEAARIFEIITEESGINANTSLAQYHLEVDPIKKEQILSNAEAINSFLAKVMDRIRKEEVSNYRPALSSKY
jgi:hypothetical protein